MISKNLKFIWLLAFGFALNPLAYADDHDDTMDMAENGETEAGFIAHSWPDNFGTTVSNMARDPDAEYQGRDFGQWVSEQVRQDMTHENHRNARADLGGQGGEGPEE